jgi:hypothetical protein
MNREQERHLALAGTVTFPATYPRVAELQLRRIIDVPISNISGEDTKTEFLVAIEHQSARTTLMRSLRVADVRAVFLPRDPHHVCLDDGVWLFGPEVGPGLRIQLSNLRAPRTILGIVHVAENTPTLLEVRCGMTAGESAQYYPPLPSDRSVNHYDPYRNSSYPIGAGKPVFCEPFMYETPCEPLMRVTSCEPLVCPATVSCDDRALGPLGSSRGPHLTPAPFPDDKS